MRRFFWGIVMLMSVVGCETNNLFGLDGDTDNTLTLSLTNTKTSLGDKEGKTYPLYWSEGDCIAANGLPSQGITINPTNRSSATFTFGAKPEYPISITYPYTSATSADTPTVTFLANQSYEYGTFMRGSAPMCGYSNGGEDKVVLKHLTTILHFSIKSKLQNVSLQKVVISSTTGEKISGEFVVDCSAGTIAPTESAGDEITYSLPESFLLSTATPQDLFISFPAGVKGDFVVEFVDGSGDKMECTWRVTTPISAGKVKEFEVVYQGGKTQSLLTPLESIEEDELQIKFPEIYGYVKDSSGKPIKGVAVSDGFSVVATDANGYYTMKPSTDAWYIFVTVPAEYEIPVNELGQPCFYTRYPTSSPQFDFTLTPLAGGKEKKFALFTFADPQVTEDRGIVRFLNEVVPEIKSYVSTVSQTMPCYGITLGDIISNNGSRDVSACRIPMRDGFSKSRIGLPVFQIMGNHDFTFYSRNKPIYSDEDSSTFELKAQRDHETIFGPVNYSFDRSDVHIVGMRDIVFTSNIVSGIYEAGFLPSQYEWLKQDLALVPKDKMVVLCLHIQLFNRTGNYIQEVLSLLNEFKEVHIISGHTHIQHNYEHGRESSPHTKLYEHNTCAVCGAWWSSNIAGDGTPNGYNVFVGEGNTFSDWYYMGYSKGMNTRESSQMRVYRGNAITGGEKGDPDTYNVLGYYQFGFGDDYILANVYNADGGWTIKVYEDGVYSGNMQKLTYKQPTFTNLIGDGTFTNPRRPTTETGHDFYVTGLLVGILGRYDSDGPGGGSYSSCYHMYKYKLKNKNAKIWVVAQDRFGNEYIETKITEGTDYSLTQYTAN